MECYHGILSMDHAIEEFVEAEGIRTDLRGGRGYIEKDWGASMPSSWIWMQTNHFDRVGVSLSGSIAKIPWLGNYFTGYIFGFLYAVLHQLDQKIIYPHYDFKHLTKKYFEIGMKLDDFLIQLVKYCI